MKIFDNKIDFIIMNYIPMESKFMAVLYYKKQEINKQIFLNRIELIEQNRSEREKMRQIFCT
jgi:hypothetical protein